MTQSNIKIAITGGIGSGKSTVAKIIANEGYNVISCDEIYKELLADKNFLNKLSGEFGNILNSNGGLDRKLLSSIVFSDKQNLKKLNAISHPLILDRALKQMSGSSLCFCEVPLLFEDGYEKLFDNVIVVLRDKSQRISSVMERDKISGNEVQNRINNQFDYDNAMFEKYYVIHNNSDLSTLYRATLETLKNIINN